MSDRLEVFTAALAALIREEVRAELEAQRGAPDKLLSVEQAAELAGVGRTSLYGLLASGRVRSVQVGRRRLVPSSAIAELAAEGARPKQNGRAPEEVADASGHQSSA